MASIGIVNRLDKLKITMDCFDMQTYAPAYVVVVDNASTDGTDAFLAGWLKKESPFEKHVITMDSNTGGSGGFYAGLERATQMDADWIWVSDDDAFPEPDALEQLNHFIENRADEIDDISAVCCRVINNGRSDFSHRRNIIRKGFRIADVYSTDADYEKECFEINCFSYVGAVMNREKLCEVGLTRKDYFIWYDDTEHSLRLSRVGKIYCVPAARIHHDIVDRPGLNWKSYYGQRNRLDMIRNHFPGYVYVFYCLDTFARAYGVRILRGDKVKSKLYLKALKDCRNDQFGIDTVYKPGWQPQETKPSEDHIGGVRSDRCITLPPDRYSGCIIYGTAFASGEEAMCA